MNALVARWRLPQVYITTNDEILSQSLGSMLGEVEDFALRRVNGAVAVKPRIAST
jgi:hypothetical protein